RPRRRAHGEIRAASCPSTLRGKRIGQDYHSSRVGGVRHMLSGRPMSASPGFCILPPEFAERVLRNIGWRCASFRLDLSRPEHLAPFLSCIGYDVSKAGGRADKQCAPEVSQPGLDFGIGEARVDLLVELVDDLGRRVLRCAEAEPD